MAVLIVSGDVCKLSLLNLQTKTEFKPPIILDWKNGLRGMVTGASKIVDNSIILQESRGNCCVVTDLNEVSFHFNSIPSWPFRARRLFGFCIWRTPEFYYKFVRKQSNLIATPSHYFLGDSVIARDNMVDTLFV